MSEETNKEVNTKQLAMVVGIAVLALAAFVAIYFGTAGYFNQGDKNTANTSPAPTAAASASPAASPAAGQAQNAAPLVSPGAIAKASASPKPVLDTKYKYEQAMKMAQDVAKKQFGDDAVVFPADEGIAEMVNIDGVDRPCFRFGADSMARIAKNESIRGKYHFDANTGEVFDYNDGKMTKVN